MLDKIIQIPSKRIHELTGNIYGRLNVLGYSGNDKHNNSKWICKCDCGKYKETTGYSLNTGHTKSCGCLSMENITTHGLSHTSEYQSYLNMIQRCNNKNRHEYKNYGGRGITVCDRWLESFESFISDMGIKPTKHHSIERTDNNGDYNSGNCIWATPEQQARNQRTRATNTSGHKGVSFDKPTGKWRARIYARKSINVGLYDSLSDAINARKEAEIKYWGAA